MILVLDSDVRGFPRSTGPAAGAAIYYVDIDPLKSQMQHVGCARPALRRRELQGGGGPDRRLRPGQQPRRPERGEAALRQPHGTAPRSTAGEPARATATTASITPEYLTACVRRLLDGEDAIVLTEVVTNSKAVAEHLRPVRPGSVIHHGGGALGWSGGAAVGAKLAAPEPAVVAWSATAASCSASRRRRSGCQRRYGRPALTVIYDNGGWAAPKFSTLQVHPDGAAAATGDFRHRFAPTVDLPGVALAAGAASA